MAKMRHMQRTMDFLRRRGWEPGVVERFLSYAGKFGKRQDLFNFIDLLAMKDDVLLAVQVTGTDFSNHIQKCAAEPRLVSWLKAGNCFEIWGWSKKGARGKRKTFQVRRLPFCLGDEILDVVPSIEGTEEEDIIFVGDERWTTARDKNLTKPRP